MIKKILISMVRFYQKYISPAFGAHCRYQPTCSQYMIDAIYTHGAIKGGTMGIARILRCHPLVKGGIDYVPPRFSLRKNKDERYQGPYRYRVQPKKPIGKLQEDECLPWELLLEADPNKEMIEKYIYESQIYVYREWNQIVGVVVIKKHGPRKYEIMNLSVAKGKQGQKIGTKLVDFTIEQLRKMSSETLELIVKTGLQPETALRFYQKCGFEVNQIVENYFIDTYPEPIFENDIQVKDQVILQQKIALKG